MISFFRNIYCHGIILHGMYMYKYNSRMATKQETKGWLWKLLLSHFVEQQSVGLLMVTEIHDNLFITSCLSEHVV